jgi:PPOX class probable F420-dependent enzyme
VLTIEGRAAERLTTDTVGWLGTVRHDGQPQSSPVWFMFDSDNIYIQSQPSAQKVRNIEAHDRVSFHLNDDGTGSDIVTLDATAEIIASPDAQVFERFLAKYESAIQAMGATPVLLAQTYSTTIRLTPTRLRAW